MLEYGASYAYIDNQGYILEISANKKGRISKNCWVYYKGR